MRVRGAVRVRGRVAERRVRHRVRVRVQVRVVRGVEVLQDGVPVNLADGSGDFYQIDPLAIRSAALYPGGNALVFGASTLGGAVNFVTPTAQTAEASNILRADGGIP